MADLERAFDTILREVAIYKLHKSGINNNFLSFFSSFLSDKYSRNLVNSHISHCFWMIPDLAVQIFKSFILSKLEYGSIIWGHTIYTVSTVDFWKQLKKALTLILKAMKSTNTKTLESELNIVPIDLRLEELQQMEAIKRLEKKNQFVTNNMGKKVNSKKLTSLTYLGHHVKQVLTVMSKHQY